MPVQDRTVIIIANPTAGGGGGGSGENGCVARFARCLRHEGMRPVVLHTAHRGHARVLAREAVQAGACTHIVAAGGDGTVAEVADGMAGSDIVLGILPVGTANVLASELGIPPDPARNARAIAAGEDTVIWPGRLRSSTGEWLFVQMVGVGFDAHVVHAVSVRMKKALGRMAYVLHTLRALWAYPFHSMTVVVDGVARPAVSVIISKGRFYGGRYVLTPRSMHEHAGFSVVLFGTAGAWASLRYSMALLCGMLDRQPDVTILNARTIEVITPTGLPVQGDGDACGLTPLHVDLPGRPLRVAGFVAVTPGKASPS
ncbi:diacylglycerol/lipid kinase family protein [Komagataeibacter medellinensis]|uniref:Sphingosine kinase n=1 Tax=Komagataeibacter medellinensis (strain NBRC 3288 / BCRC 11682 / LMG 1693 / Kondo 51) TaxID=634177 RepID=G2I370_KOMMN|nr:diacylglycerol kinase family protein [Komagataeibacter medellinensis]BAK82675.1 sphingosine kinase [Komagataeibacter medellinensis NBRC 3288]